MTADPREAALAAYWKFIDGFNSRSPERWSDGLNFPHVRVPGRAPIRFVATREEHDSGMSWEPVIATGWDHSVGAPPEVLHVSPDVVHIRGGWTRYNKAGAPILVNQVTYIVTRMLVEGREHWGMQARFGADPGPDGPTQTHADLALALVGRYLDAWNAQDFDTCGSLMNYPLVQVRPGEVRRFDAAAQLVAQLRRATWQRVVSRKLAAIQAAPTAVNVAIDMQLERPRQAVFLVTERAGHWGIQGRSIIEP